MDFCTKCGSELDGSDICPKCGAKVEKEAAAESSTAPSADKGNKGIIKAIVAIVIIVACCFILFGGRSYKSAVKDYINAYKKGDAKKIVSLMPEKYVNHMIKYGYEGDKEKLIEELKDSWEDDIKGKFEDKDVDINKVKFEIDDKHVYEKDDLRALRKEEKMGAVKKAIRADVEFSVKDDAGDMKYSSADVMLVKIGRSWYVVPNGEVGDAFQALLD